MLTWATPWFFLLLPLPILVYYCLPAQKKIMDSALTLPFFDELTQHLRDKASKKNYLCQPKTLLLIFIWLLLIIAAARPVIIGEPINTPTVAHNIMLAMDISGSMDIADMQANGHPVDRLYVIKAVANRFINERTGDRLGLIVFGTRAYLLTPITADRHIVGNMLNDMTVGLGGPLTAIGDAIGLAVKKLQAFPEKSRVLILLTDGVNNSGQIDPLQAAKLASDYHIKIYTIGFGADKLEVPTLFGSEYVNPSADLDEKTLRDIAKITGGIYFRATNLNDLKQVYDAINNLEPVSANQHFRLQTELYPFPLSLALLLSIYLAWLRSHQPTLSLKYISWRKTKEAK